MMMLYSGAIELSFDCASAAGDIIVKRQLGRERAPLGVQRLNGES